MTPTTFLEETREISNRIWNAGAKLTHNELDEILFTALTAAYELRTKEVLEMIEKMRIEMVQHEDDKVRQGLLIAAEYINKKLSDLSARLIK